MKTIFANALSLVGLDQNAAANYLEVRLDTVKSWRSGRRKIPYDVWLEIAKLYSEIEKERDTAAVEMEGNINDILKLNYVEEDNNENALLGDGKGRSEAMAVLSLLNRGVSSLHTFN